MNVRSTLLALALGASAALMGCTEQQFNNGCTTNDECPVGSACRITGADTTGICICRSDEACGEGEICNSQGICQERSGCRTTSDCVNEPNTFCDVGSGNCIALTACGTAVHCDRGFVCDAAAGACVPGCFSDGDCPLYAVCSGAAPGVIGTCLTGMCGDKSFCEYGDLCTGGACMPHPNQNNCLPCGGANRCPGPSDFCLSNNQWDPNRPETGPEAFCSIECNSNEACPNGYNCVGIVVPTQSDCTNDAQCGPGSNCNLGEAATRGWCSCRTDEECSPNELPPRCVKSCAGLGIQQCETDADCLTTCQSTCQSPQGQACNDDSQCAPQPLCQNNTCLTNGQACAQGRDCLCNIDGRCINSGRPCATAADCGLTCDQGGCRIGAGCAPAEGLLCPDLR